MPTDLVIFNEVPIFLRNTHPLLISHCHMHDVKCPRETINSGSLNG